MTGPITPRTADLELGGLAALEAVVAIAARALLATYPEINRVERPGDPPLIVTARTLVDDCEQLLAAVDNHRNLITCTRRSAKAAPLPRPPVRRTHRSP